MREMGTLFGSNILILFFCSLNALKIKRLTSKNKMCYNCALTLENSFTSVYISMNALMVLISQSFIIQCNIWFFLSFLVK